jgi:hypothetical protein
MPSFEASTPASRRAAKSRVLRCYLLTTEHFLGVDGHSSQRMEISPYCSIPGEFGICAEGVLLPLIVAWGVHVPCRIRS